MYGVGVDPKSSIMIEAHGRGLESDPRYCYVELSIDEVLFEGGRSIR